MKTDAVSVVRGIGRAGKRIYALLLVLVLLYVFYLAISYLVVMVFTPAPVPSELLERPTQLQASALRSEDVPGLTAPAGRAPFSHYHQVDRWLLVDKANGCTVSGCHDPLPHSKSVYVRSFANLHSTFLTCEMCHEPVKEKPVKAGWVSTQTGERTDPPGLVQLVRLLQTQRDEIAARPAEFHESILVLLGQIVAISRDPLLEYLRVEIDTAEPGSPVWREAVARLESELPLHSRGEYAAKIARLDLPRTWLARSEQFRRAAEEYLKAPADSPQRKRMSDEMHAQVLKAPDRCLACHGEAPPLLDFTVLGYSPQRASFLVSNPIAQQVQSVREGRQFYLPRIGEGRQ